MIWFNVIFGLAMLAAIRVLFADISYAHTIRSTAAVAMIPDVYDILKDNTHFRKSISTASSELLSVLQIWIPLSVVAIISMSFGWWHGYNNQWLLEESMCVWMAIVTLPLYARPWTHPTDLTWLTAWATGIRVVVVANEYEKTKARLDELTSIPIDDITPVQFVEFQALSAKMHQLEQIIGKLPEPQQSEQKE